MSEVQEFGDTRPVIILMFYPTVSQYNLTISGQLPTIIEVTLTARQRNSKTAKFAFIK
jgi:hypothetical protein